jgi:hypothetical protein
MEFAAKHAPQSSPLTPGLTAGIDANSAASGDASQFPRLPSMPEEAVNEQFWKKHPGLIWSNRQASDAVRIRAALMKPSFPVLLDIAAVFGPERLEQEWAVLRSDPETDTHRIEHVVSQILANIWRGYHQARA